jgi:hypothetical protein
LTSNLAVTKFFTVAKSNYFGDWALLEKYKSQNTAAIGCGVWSFIVFYGNPSCCGNFIIQVFFKQHSVLH